MEKLSNYKCGPHAIIAKNYINFSRRCRKTCVVSLVFSYIHVIFLFISLMKKDHKLTFIVKISVTYFFLAKIFFIRHDTSLNFIDIKCMYNVHPAIRILICSTRATRHFGIYKKLFTFYYY